MIELLEKNREGINQLCERCRVRRLEVFGSAARGDFDPSSSDIDFFYEFDSDDRKNLADRFFNLLEGLESLLGRPVQLVSLKHVRNPYFLNSARRDCAELYAA